MDKQNKEQDWEFNAPKYWDLTESTLQTRPNEKWFRKSNISGPSFPTTTTTKTIKKKQPLKTESVYDRLSRRGTISSIMKQTNVDDATKTKQNKSVVQELNERFATMHDQEAYQITSSTHTLSDEQNIVSKDRQDMSTVELDYSNKNLEVSLTDNHGTTNTSVVSPIQDYSTIELTSAEMTFLFFEHLKADPPIKYNEKCKRAKSFRNDILEPKTTQTQQDTSPPLNRKRLRDPESESSFDGRTRKAIQIIDESREKTKKRISDNTVHRHYRTYYSHASTKKSPTIPKNP